MSIKKCVNGSFVNDVYREYGTDTDTITTLPKTITGDGQPISAYTIKGNMVQSGTPTPSNPIYPTEVGDKTANLLDLAQPIISAGNRYIYNGNFTFDGEAVTFKANFYCSLAMVDNNDTEIVNRALTANTALTVNTPNGIKSLRIYTPNAITEGYVMINSGSTALDYEPYGMYKIPISFNQTTYNIYISEPLRKSLDGSNVYDTIESNGTLTRRVDANGDALATPTTEQVTVPTLTTTGTPEQFNVLTTLAPSEVSLTYHGWHEHQDTKFTT